MPLSTINISGRVPLPNDGNPASCKVSFTLSGHDTDSVDDATILPEPLEVEADGSGNISIDLWPNDRGIRNTWYSVQAKVPTTFSGTRQYNLGLIQLVDGADVQLEDVLSVSPAASPAVDFTAAQSAAKAEEWADKAEDSEVETGKFSARHHAAKAADEAAAALASQIAASSLEISGLSASLTGYSLVAKPALSPVPSWYRTGIPFRQREQQTSWYNETLVSGEWLGQAANETAARALNGAADGDYYHNTTDGLFYELDAGSGETEVFRGNQAEFPEVPVGLLEASRLVILDGTKPDLPMWKVVDLTGFTVTTITLINGSFFVGTTTGAIELNFATDEIDAVLKYSTSTSPAIVNNMVNYIDVMIKDDAPVPGWKGFPEPTVVMATDGGTSILKDNGSVVDVTYSSEGLVIEAEFYGGNVRSVVGFATGSFNATIHVYEIPSSDVSNGPSYNRGANDKEFYLHGDHPAASGADLILNTGYSGIDRIAGNVVGSSTSGLNFISINHAVPSGGMVSYMTTTYLTGWMQGDCELAICDSLTDRSATGTIATDNGIAVVADIVSGSDQKKITASGGTITAPVTTGGSIYGWELVSSVWYFRAGTGWVGVSESGGTLTVADGTTVAMLRYTNGSGPSADQFALMEQFEKPVINGADCLIPGGSDAILDVDYDAVTGLVHFVTSAFYAAFSGFRLVASEANSSNWKKVAAHSGFVGKG